MPRYPLHLATGTGVFTDWHTKIIRLARYGCANRPFFHIVVIGPKAKARDPPIEQIGTYDPMANQYNEKLVAINFERLQFWLGQGNVEISRKVARLIGLSGFLPIHPDVYRRAWSGRQAAAEAAARAEEAEAKIAAESAEQTN